MANVRYTDDQGDQAFELNESVCTFGRSSDNSCMLRDRELSRQHFQIERTEFGFKVVDRESRNGTKVNDSFVNQHLLRPGDRIQVGKLVLTFQDPDFVEPPAGGDPDTGQAPRRPPTGNEPESKLMKPQFSSSSSDNPSKPTPSRIRSGGTTAIHRVRPSQRGSIREDGSGSKSLLTGILAVLGLFLGLVVLIVVIGSLNKDGQPTKKKQEDSAGKNRSDESDPNELAHLADIQDRLSRGNFPEALQLVEAFLARYPESDNVKIARKYRREAEQKVNSVPRRKYNNFITRLKDLRREKKFGQAIREISAQLVNPDFAPYQTKLTKEKNDLLLAGKTYYKARIAEGEVMIERGDVSGAQIHFGRLKRELARGEEFQLLLEIIQTHLDSLRNR